MYKYPDDWTNGTCVVPHNTIPDEMDSIINLCNGVKMLHKMGNVSEQVWDLDVRPSIISILEVIYERVQALVDDHCIEN